LLLLPPLLLVLCACVRVDVPCEEEKEESTLLHLIAERSKNKTKRKKRKTKKIKKNKKMKKRFCSLLQKVHPLPQSIA